MACRCSCHQPPTLRAYSTESNDYNVHLLDEEIKRARKHLSSLLNRRNLLSPTVRIRVLPSELLSYTFILVRRASKLFERKWIALAHVCHQWRQVALTTPHLWTAIDYSSPTVMPDFIARAAALPLALSISTRRTNLFEEAQRHARRARGLLVNIYSEELPSGNGRMDAVDRLLSCSFPSLRSLTVKAIGFRNSGDEPVIPSKHTAPNLRVISLYSIAVRWESLQSCMLTALSIHGNGYLVDIDKFLNVLHSNNLLEILSVTYTMGLTPFYDWEKHKGHFLSLPNLRLLRIDGIIGSIPFLDYMRSVSRRRFILRGPADEETAKKLTRSLHRLVYDADQSCIEEMAMEYNLGQLILLGWTDHPSMNFPLVDLSIALTSNMQAAAVLCNIMCSDLASRIQMLRLHASTTLLASPWSGERFPLSELRTVATSGSAWRDMLACLPPDMFPNLTLIDHSHGSNVSQLEAVLRKWQEQGFRVPTVQVCRDHPIDPNIAKNIIYVDHSEHKLYSKIYATDVEELMETMTEGKLLLAGPP
jgi:hypothetical protein